MQEHVPEINEEGNIKTTSGKVACKYCDKELHLNADGAWQ